MSFQPSEVVCLLIALAFAIPAGILTRGMTFGAARWFLGAVYFALGGAVLTVVEAAALPIASNYLEHLCYVAAACCLAAGTRRLSTDLR